MKNLELLETISEFKEFKDIDKDTLGSVLEDVFRNMIIRSYGSDENFDVIINLDKGDFEIWQFKAVVEDDAVTNSHTEISLTDAKIIDATYEVGEEVSEEIKLENFGRRAVLSLRQNLSSKIMDIEKAAMYEKYKLRIGEIVTGEVYQVWKKEILVLDEENNELLLPRMEQIPTDFYRKGDTIKAIVSRVDIRNNNPVIILSRIANEFLQKLFELEVPEVYDGLITIKKIARIPGEKAKIAVESYDERIDPVGACVGVKGSRIYAIVKELRNENIDVINYTSNMSLFVQRSLSPAKIAGVTLDDEQMVANVTIKPSEIFYAIGKGGNNVKLATMLSGYRIEIYRENEEEEDDVLLTDFSDEIEPWVIEEFNKIGCDTAKSVLAYSVEDLANRTDLETETIESVMDILRQEFEQD